MKDRLASVTLCSLVVVLSTGAQAYDRGAQVYATARVLAIKPEVHAVAYLEEPYIDKELARTGPFDFYAVTGSMTLETKNQDCNFFADGFLKA